MPDALRRSLTWLTAAALLVAAALWFLAAQALWETAVPSSVHLPHVDPGAYFSSSFLSSAASFELFLAIDALLGSIVLVVVLAIYARRGHRLMRESAAGRIGTGMLLGMLGFGIVWIAEIPFGLAAVWWERRHGVSHQSYLTWIVNSFLGLGSEFVFISFALAIAMGIAGVMRRWWWLVAAPLFVGLALLYTFVSPYLIPATHPVHNPRLAAEARALERREGVEDARLRVQEVHRYTTAPNAESTGFGPTSTVVLWDTLLDGRFSDGEVRAVLAHELGHLSHKDALRGVGWLALFLIPAAGAIAFATRRRGGMARPEAVPIAILTLVVLQLLTTPFSAMVSRNIEAAADWAALEATHEPRAFRETMVNLAVQSHADPDPPTWSYALFQDHPTIAQRIAMSRAWEERNGPGR